MNLNYDHSEFEIDGTKLIKYTGNKPQVLIPEGVTSIGKFAFDNCHSLTNIVIPNSVTSIGRNAFSYCSSLRHVTIGKGVTSIDVGAFCECSSLTSITIPDSVTSIGGHAFRKCFSLRHVTIGNGVTSIGEEAFYACDSLMSVSIGKGVSSIGNGAFSRCPLIIKITVDSGNTVYHSLNNCIIETVSKTLVLGCQNSVIPTDGSVTSIGDFAFQGCASLKNVIIPDGITSIGDHAFDNCHFLTSIVIPNGVTSIGDYAFFSCDSLESVTIPDSVTSIGNGAFEYCSRLKSVTIPDSVISIGNSAFQNCFSLTNVTIGKGVTIAKNAFEGCTLLKRRNFMPEKDYFDLLDKLVRDIDREITNFKDERFNIFEATGMNVQEVKHSRFLANLLNPKYPHGLGNKFLKNFLEKLFDYEQVSGMPKKNEDILNVSKKDFLGIADKDITVSTERNLTIEDGGRVDICIETDDDLIVIENKMFTSTHDEQLCRYEDEFSEKNYKIKVFIYLTPNGELPVENGIIRQNWCVMSYERIKLIINELKIKDAKLKSIMEDYVSMIDKNILKGNCELLKACERVYKENRDAIELVIRCAQTSVENILVECAKIIKEKYPQITIYSIGKSSIYFYTETMKTVFGEPDKKCRGVLLSSDGGKSIRGYVEFIKNKDEKWDKVQSAYIGGAQKKQEQYIRLDKSCSILKENERGEDFNDLIEKIKKRVVDFFDNYMVSIDNKLKSINNI